MYSSLTLVKLPTDNFLNGITIVVQEGKHFSNFFGNTKKDTDFQGVVDMTFRMSQSMLVNFSIKLYCCFFIIIQKKRHLHLS